MLNRLCWWEIVKWGVYDYTQDLKLLSVVEQKHVRHRAEMLSV